jgi:hypothetical protein
LYKLFRNYDEEIHYLANSLDKCKERAKIQGEVTHDALEDAWDVIELLRTQY